MHLLTARPGGFVDEEGIVDLAQTPAEIVILSAADSSLAILAQAADEQPDDAPGLRLANWMQLKKPAAFDLYQETVLRHARLVIVSLLGGASYWAYAVERLQEWAESTGRTLILVPGDDTEDPELRTASNCPPTDYQRVWRYLRESGFENARQLLNFLAAAYFSRDVDWREPRALPPVLVYRPGQMQASVQEWQRQWQPGKPLVMLLFYRSHLLSGNTQMFDRLIEQIQAQGLNPLPVALVSLKDPVSLELINHLLAEQDVDLILSTLGFASHTVATTGFGNRPGDIDSPFADPTIAVLQLILASTTEADWLQQQQGLRSRDLAMQIVLPEMDGRVITRAVSFKTESRYSERCEISVVQHVLHTERARRVAQLALAYCRLRQKPPSQKRLALILANYPTKDGRIGNGVGLDTPASCINILQAMRSRGYKVADIPESGNALIEALLGAVTNNPVTLHQLPCWQSMAVDDYLHYFQQLPEENRSAIMTRWGRPEDDPKCRQGRLMLSGIRLGETFVGIQPARGFNLDLAANYHDPDLVPPHSYLAFYFWLRHEYRVDAVIHVGKHGNLEWLPGKGSALSESCWPDAILGPVPHFYPFIVNDPGEGSQAKRRTQAVIIDHLMPPMTRAETYAGLATLENLVDEYYQAQGMDTAREDWLREKILTEIESAHISEELAVSDTDDESVILAELDTYLCDIKEAQIRDGLHILGQLPQPPQLIDTLVALMRLPRGTAPEEQGILHNLASDFGWPDFEPLQADNSPWLLDKPALLQNLTPALWRTAADTRERLEILAQQLLKASLPETGESDESQQRLLQLLPERLPRTARQLGFCRDRLFPVLQQSADQEINALLDGLQGQHVAPGPSGAPTRGRLDVLPTGRNFFSVDNRSIPSPAAWALGKKSAQALIDRYLQEHGEYPEEVGLSVWGTATMRTGGDDIAQAFALMGVKPVWAEGSQRVCDFIIVPAMQLGRPRVDVTLRISGFFRDAFPNVIKLFDAAVQAIADYAEPGQDNCIRKHIRQRTETLSAQGMSASVARRQASYRVYGSKPGAYGAGLQGLIDERCWETRADLARAYVNWGGYAYGNEAGDAVEARDGFTYRLSQLQAVLHNQDNREHDVLDSDDYYQFQGGMAAAVHAFSGSEPAIYHADHSNPAVPKIRSLQEELNRVIRTRLLNPKWINAMRRHGYKGAFEMSASVDYLFAYDATTNLIADYQYEMIADTLVFDAENFEFMQANNPTALEEMAERLLEATQRGLWQEPGEAAEKLQQLLLGLDEARETEGG